MDIALYKRYVDAFSLWVTVAVYIPTYYLCIAPVRQIEIWLKLRSKK